MSLLEGPHDRWPSGPAGALFGVSVGTVTDNSDPDGLGRVRVRLSWLPEDQSSWWARVAAPMAGKQRGVFFLPEVGDEVLVAFEHGRPEFAYVLGGLWNGADAPPYTNSGGKNHLRAIRSRGESELRFDDTPDAEKIVVTDKNGDNMLEIDVKAGRVTIKAAKEVVIAAATKLKIGDGDADLEIKVKSFKVECTELNVNNGSLEVK